MSEVPVEVPTFGTVTAPQPRQAGTNRPLIRPPGGGDLEAYTRVSTLASYLDDQVGIRAWDIGNIAIGIARHPDLQAMLAGCVNWQDPDVEKYVEFARDRMGSNYKANLGTAVHRATEPGADPANFPEPIRLDALTYLEALDQRGVVQLEAEQFVVCDGIQDGDRWLPVKAAGTFDRVLYVPQLEAIGQNPRVVLDVKSGKFHYRALAVQLTCYSHGDLYDHATETRTPLDVNRRWALCAWIPQGEKRTVLRWIDLRRDGYRALRLAMDLRAWRSEPMPRHFFDDGPFTEWTAAVEAAQAGDPYLSDDELDQVLATATSVEMLRQVWGDYRGRFDDRRTTIAAARAAVLAHQLP